MLSTSRGTYGTRQPHVLLQLGRFHRAKLELPNHHHTSLVEELLPLPLSIFRFRPSLGTLRVLGVLLAVSALLFCPKHKGNSRWLAAAAVS